MPAIAIIDDRDDNRRTNKLMISKIAAGRIDVRDFRPLAQKSDYPSWLLEHDISALIVDEKLGEQAAQGGRHVEYSGHDVVDIVRQHQPTFPIFVLTNYPGDPAVKRRTDLVEEIIDKRHFGTSAKPFVERMVRAASRFSEQREEALSELGRISAAIAQGSATDQDKSRALALQTELNIAFPIHDYTTRSEWLNEAEEALKEAEALKQELARLLKDKK